MCMLFGIRNPGCRFACPGLCACWAFCLLSEACKTKWPPERYHALCAYTPSGRMFTHLTDEPFYERMSMFFVFLGVFLVRMSTKQGDGVLHV